jgi:CHRD domain
MSRLRRSGMLLAVIVTAAAMSTAAPAASAKTVRVQLDGFQEVPQAIATDGEGRFRASIERDQIEFRLNYAGLASAVIGAHIHFGRQAINGGIIVFFCQDPDSPLGPPPAGVPECPDGDQEITGTIPAAEVVGPDGQGIAPGEFDKLLEAIRAGATYVNVHTLDRPTGEIRGQVDGHRRHF